MVILEPFCRMGTGNLGLGMLVSHSRKSLWTCRGEEREEGEEGEGGGRRGRSGEEGKEGEERGGGGKRGRKRRQREESLTDVSRPLKITIR